MIWMMLKAFMIYLVVVFFMGIFRTWRALRKAKKAFQEAQRQGQKKQERSQGGVVEAEYRVLPDSKS